MLTVREILQSKSLSCFTLVAGEQGLGRQVTSAGILDFEYLHEIDRGQLFDKNSFVISSLLFARENEDLLLQAMQDLIDSGVSAFAYKNIFYTSLPAPVLELAERAGFPVFVFTDAVYFEDVVFEIMEAAKQHREEQSLEEKIGKIASGILTEQETLERLREINPYLGENLIALSFLKKGSGFDIAKQKQHAHITVSPLDGAWIMLAGSDDETKLNEILREGIQIWEVDDDSPKGISLTHRSTGVRKAIQEARFARIAADVEGKTLCAFSKIGQYRFLIPNIGSENIQEYMRSYLAPILESGETELLKTAVQFVLAEGDISKAAECLFCHRNTVRYRIGKLHRQLDPEASDFLFHEHLSTAVRIHLLTAHGV